MLASHIHRKVCATVLPGYETGLCSRRVDPPESPTRFVEKSLPLVTWAVRYLIIPSGYQPICFGLSWNACWNHAFLGIFLSHQPKALCHYPEFWWHQALAKGCKRYKGVSPSPPSGLAALLASLVWDWILIPTQPSRTMVPFVARSGCGTASRIASGGMSVFRVESW